MDLQFLLLIDLILVLFVFFLVLQRRWRRRPQLETYVRTDRVIHDAIRQANAMLVEAELDSLEVVARQKVESRKTEDQYRQRLEKLFGQLEQQTQRLEVRYEEFIQQLETTAQNSVQEFLAELEDGLESQFADQLKRVERSLLAYKKQRQHYINQQAVVLLERTLELTLDKSFGLSEHSEIVLDSLKRAKKEGFFNE